MMPVMDIVTYMMDIVIYMSCICFWEFLDVKNKKKYKKLGQFAVRRRVGARQIDPKWQPQQEICRAPRMAHGKLTILCRAPRHKTHDNGPRAPGAWTILCRVPSGMTHGKGPTPPCAWTILCRAPRHVTHDKGPGPPDA
jgi:hypothetical protein